MKRNNVAPSLSVHRKETKPKPLKKNLIIKLDPWVEFWNDQPNLSNHKSPRTKTYRAAAALARELTKGLSGAYSWDAKWLKRYNIQKRFLTEPWPEITLRRAIETLNEMAQPGNYPGPDSWLTRLSFASAIYNPFSRSSAIVFARSNPRVQTLKKSVYAVAEQKLDPQTRALLSTFNSANIDIDPSLAEKIATAYKTMAAQNVVLRHISRGCEGFGQMLVRWLVQKNELDPGGALSPPDGWLWKKFTKELAI